MKHPIHPDTIVVCDALIALQPGQSIDYGELSKLLGRPVRGDDPRVQAGKRRAEGKDGYVFAADRGVGMKRLTDAEIANLGDAMVGGIRRAARRGVRRITNMVDFNALPPDAKARQQGAVALLGAVATAASAKVLRKAETASAQNGGPLSLDGTLRLFDGKGA